MLRSFLGRTLVFYHTPPQRTSQSPVSLNMYYRVPKFELSLPQILQTSAKKFHEKKKIDLESRFAVSQLIASKTKPVSLILILMGSYVSQLKGVHRSYDQRNPM